MADLRLALNAIPLLTPLTGVGQYTRQLALRLGQMLAEPPFLFYGSHWSREVRSVPADPPNATVARAKRAIPLGHRMARALQQLRFSQGTRRLRPALYHEPNYLSFSFAGPSVVTVHDLSWVRYPGTHPAERVATMNAAMPRVVRDATRLIADSEFTRGEVIEHYGVAPERIATVPLGVLPEFHPRTTSECAAFLARHGLRFASYLLVVGTLEPRKNLATAVAAFERLPPAIRREFPLVVAGGAGWGSAAMPDSLRALVAAGEARLPGYVAQEELPLLYAGARAFAYPSLYEGFGLPPLEAMASGVPVVVSARASLPEVVGDAGILVEALDADGFAAALEVLVEDESRHRQLAQAGLARAAGYTWQACAERTIRIYAEAMAAGR